MKTYKEYYQIGLDEHLDWKSKQKDEWWRAKQNKDELELKGEYLETITPLSEEEKNDSPLFKNHTNVKNSEWVILFGMLGQALIDWCVENGKQENLWFFSIKVKRVVDGIEDLYIPSFNVKYYFPDTQVVKSPEDESKREGFVDCQDFLLGLISEFLERNKRDLPLDWNMFCFGLDDLEASCRYGVWTPASDGYMDLASLASVDDKNKKSELYVECM